MTGWKTLALERAQLLEDEISDLRGYVDTADEVKLDGLRDDLVDVRENHVGVRDHFAWLTGNAINESWNELHRIEQRIVDLKPDLLADDLVDLAERHIEKETTGRQATELANRLEAAHSPASKKKVAAEVIREAHECAEERHESERNQQRGILNIAAGFLFAAVVMLVAQVMIPASDQIIPSPSGGASMANWVLLGLVMMFGMLGGALSALVSLYMAKKKLTNTLWFDPRPALTLVKVVMGLWTGVLGVLVVGTGLVVGTYTSLAALLLLALMFGYSQQAGTRFIDRKVPDIVAAERT